MTRPLGEIVGGKIAVEQLCGTGGVHRTVAAVNMLLQFRARSIAAHADAVPAIDDDRVVETSSRVRAFTHVTSCCVAPAGARGFAESARRPCRPASPSAGRGGSVPRRDWAGAKAPSGNSRRPQ